MKDDGRGKKQAETNEFTNKPPSQELERARVLKSSVESTGIPLSRLLAERLWQKGTINSNLPEKDTPLIDHENLRDSM